MREKVGKVKFFLSYASVHKSLQKDLGLMLSQFAALNVVLLTAILAVLRRVVIRPIVQLGDALTDIASSEADLSARLPEQHVREISKLTRAFNAFAEKQQEALGASLDSVQQAVGESSDAYHMSAPHPQGLGARLAMAAALRSASLSEADICLLYTSPSPRDRTRSRMPSSA